MPSAGQHMQQSNVIKEKKWQIKIIIRKTSYLNNIYWYKRCAPLGNVWYMLFTTACNQKRRLCLGVMWYLTCRGCRLDVDRGWFNHREHSCLQGLDDNSLGLYGSLGMSQGHSCNHGFWLDGNLRPNLNGPLDWRRLFVCMTVKVVGVKNTFFIYIYMKVRQHHLGGPGWSSLEVFWPLSNSQNSYWNPNTLKQERAATVVRRPHPRQ